MTQVANHHAMHARLFSVAQSAMDTTRPARLPAPLPTPDTPELTSSSSGLFSAADSDSDSSFCSGSPLSPPTAARFKSRHGSNKDHAVLIWEPSFPSASTSPFHLASLGLSLHQYHVGDDGGDDYDLPMPVPPNSPNGSFPLNDNPSAIHRQHKPLPFLTKFMDSVPIMDLIEAEEARDMLRDGERPLAPVKSAFETNGFGVLEQGDVPLDDSALRVLSISKEERTRKVQSLRLQSPFDLAGSSICHSPTPSLTSASSKNTSLPRLDTNTGLGTLHLVIRDDETSYSAQFHGAIALTGPSPIYSKQSLPSSRYRDAAPKPQRRWTIGSDEDGVNSPMSALLSPLGGATFSSLKCDSPSPCRPLRPSLPSLSDPTLMTTWQFARRAMLSCREIARSERHYLASLRSLLGHEAQVPCLPGRLIKEHVPLLVSVSEAFVDALGEDPSSQGVANAFLVNEVAIQSAFVAWTEAIKALNLSVVEAKALRDVMELPADRVAKYIFLFQDILSHSPPSSPSWSMVQTAAHSAMRIARMCEGCKPAGSS